jgi:hypothetical protein
VDQAWENATSTGAKMDNSSGMEQDQVSKTAAMMVKEILCSTRSIKK